MSPRSRALLEDLRRLQAARLMDGEPEPVPTSEWLAGDPDYIPGYHGTLEYVDTDIDSRGATVHLLNEAGRAALAR